MSHFSLLQALLLPTLTNPVERVEATSLSVKPNLINSKTRA